MIHPVNSQSGLSGIIQLNYFLSEKTSLYVNTGYSWWDRYYVRTDNDINGNRIHGSDDHRLFSLNAGTSFNLHKNNFLNFYINLQAGYSYLAFNGYQVKYNINPETGLKDWYTNLTSKIDNIQHVFSASVGGLFKHPVNKKTDLTFSVMLNSFVHPGYHGFFSSGNTYALVTGGIEFYL